MRYTTHRFTLIGALCCCALLLAIGMAASAGAGRAAAPEGDALHGSLAPLDPAFLKSLTGPAIGVPMRTIDGRGLGDGPSPQDFSYARGMQVPGASDRVLPATYDLRTLGRLTSVKDQDPWGACWTFATCGSLESCLLPGTVYDFSEDNMVLTSGFDTGSTPALKYEAGGTIFMATAYLARWGGPMLESQDPYGDSITPPGLTPSKHVQEVNWIPARASATDNANIKNALMQYGGAYVSIGWYGSSAGSSYYNASTKSYYYNGAESTNHGVLIVGWNDNYAASNFATTPPGNGAFIIKNSWGPGWGQNGYFYVSYYDPLCGRTKPMAVFNKAEAPTNYSGIYQYDPLGMTQQWGKTSSSTPQTGWFANVFNATKTASLSAVGFYAMAPNTTYQVYTGTGTNVAVRTLRTSGTLAYMGYHTVTLPAPVALTSGQKFFVEVKVTSPGTTKPVAVEYPIAGFASPTASTGQSYVSPDGATWQDLAAAYPNTNVCLKAFTKAALTTTRYQESNTLLTYSPAWTAVTNAACSLGTMRTRAAAGSVTATFTGTAVSVVAAKGPAYGKLSVTLDNVAQPVVDLYAAATAYQQKVYVKSGLTNAAHTLKLAWTGTKNALATGTTVNFDALDVTGTLTQAPLPTVRYQESSTLLTYSPAWTAVTNAYCSGGYMRTRSAAGLVIASFKGTGISLYATKGPAYGKLKVTVDGAATTVDLYAAALTYQQKVFTKVGLANAAHTLRLDWTNTKNALATATTVNLDALDVQGALTALPTTRYQESTTLLTYSPAWTALTNAACSLGSMRTRSAAGSLTATFSGTGVGVLATKGPAYGKLKVTLDNVVQPTVDLYAAATAYQQKVYAKTGLAYAAHTLKLEWTGTKNALATATTVNLDALDVTGTLTQAPAPVTNDTRLFGKWIWYFSVILPVPITYEADEFLFKTDGTFEKLIVCKYPGLSGSFHTAGKWAASGGNLTLSNQLESWTPDGTTPAPYSNKVIPNVVCAYSFANATTVIITEDGDAHEYEKQ